MTTAEAPAEVARFQISVCGTCDVVFRVHPGRPSCPVCGGDPDQVLIEGSVEEAPTAPPAPTGDEEAPAPPAASTEPPSPDGPTPRRVRRRKDI